MELKWLCAAFVLMILGAVAGGVAEKYTAAQIEIARINARCAK